MTELILENIGKNFGSTTAVHDVNLRVPNGKFVCLLGPSGCGKTTLLRIIAGLTTPSEGQVILDGQTITSVPAHKRNFGMVFQSLALFPHLTVGENIAFGMRIRKLDRDRQNQRVEELLEMVRLPGLSQRYISQLSGGQRQRVAIARSLTLDPKLFLLDEPLSALDAKLREAMQVELRMLQQRLRITTIAVTHDQREAMTMSDLIVVMGDNRVQQIGTPIEIYRNPANTFVADFIGTSNLLVGKAVNSNQVLIGESLIRVKETSEMFSKDSQVTVSIRPEDVHVISGEQNGENRLSGIVTFVRDVGASIETYIECGQVTVISIDMPKNHSSIEQGDKVTVELPMETCLRLSS